MGLHQYNTKGFCDLCGTRYSLGLDYMLEGNYYVVTGMGSCTDSELIIPNNYNGLPVAKIGAEAFWNRNELISVTVPGTVTVIEPGAFGACYQLQNVYLSEGVEVIGRYAFQDCSRLTNINIPSTVKEIKDDAFSWCSELRSIHLPAGLVTLGNTVFYYCQNLQQITVDADNANYCAVDGVLYTKDMTTLLLYPAAKEGASFAVPSTVTIIGNAAFANNRNLTEVILQEGVVNIGAQAFQDCRNLRNVVLPSTLTAISYNAFRSCAISTITIPARVSKISNGIFAGCENLTEILVEQGSVSYCSVDGVWYTADMTTLLTYPAGKSAASFAIPEGVNSLYVESFNGCQYLQEVIFPASLTSISNSAFQSCGSLTAVVLPEGVTRIENYAFNDCYNLQSITIPAGVTYLGNRMLGYCNRLTNVYYMGTIAQWESIEKANQWNMIDWNGKTWDSLVRFCGECNINGHNWQAATCTAPKTCANCAMTEGTALGHDYVDDACIRCGMMNYDGKVVKIYSPYGQSYLGITSHKDGMILSVAEDEAALWTMIQDEDGYYAFSWEGYYLAADGGNYTLGLYSRMTERTKWELIPVDGGFYLRHIYAYQNGWNGEYLYFYSSVFTSLSLNEKHLEQFVFHLIPASACDVNGHVLSEGNCQQDIFCTVCGLFCGKGDHQYVGTVCVVCGDEHVSEGLEYRLSDDRRSYIVVGIGSCMDSLLIIPATYNGLPVVRIEDGAFEYCQQLTSVILPEGLQSIGWSAFRNCNNLKQVQLPDSLTEIEGWAFAYCGQLEDICIPAGVTEYRTYTFIGCYSLERIAVSAANPALTEQDGVLYTKDMSTLLFYPVGKQDNRFVVPDSVTAINGSAFGGCNNLTAIELPEGLREIGYGAFSGAGLKTVKIPSTVTYIGMYAFENNYNLTTVTIPAGVTFVGNGAFMECENLVEIVVDQQNTSYCAVDGVLYTKNGKNIVSYPAGKVGTAFVVPEGVKTINAHAFQGCHLTEVVLSNGVTTIDGLAFQHCHELERVTIPMTVKTIRNWAFGGSNRLTEFLYAGGEASWNAIEKEQGWDEAIGEYHVVFYAFCREGHTLVEASCSAPKHCLNCDYAEGDVLPHNYVNGVCIYCGEVDHGAVFAQGVCGDNITWALYEDGHLALTGFGFMYDYGYDDYSAPWLVYADQIKTLHIGDDITYIGHYAFIYLTGLTEVIIPADVEYVGIEAFAYCTGLERLYVFGLQSCGFRLFKGCTNLKDVFFFNLNMDMTLMYFCQRTALEDTVERLYLLADLINISDSEFCAFTCTNKPEYVHVGDYEMIMFTKGNHSWQTVIDEEPTCYEWGSAYDVCTVCGAEGNWTELLPMHHYNEDYICVLCGRMPAYVVCCGLQKNDLIKGEDGVYRTAEGQEVLIAVSASLEVLEGLSLADFVEAYSDDLDMESWYKLLAVTNEDGYAPMTDETYGWFLAVAFEYLLEEEEAYISVFLGFYVDRNCDHVWKEATCSSPKTCVNCGCVEGGTVDHRYENGFCTMCGKEEPVQIIAGGICGDNVYWELTGNGVLTFTGFGPMYEGSMNGPETPWMQYADMVREVYIEEGITRLTHYAFAYFTKLTTITVPASVEQISCGAFLDCTGLQSAVLYNAHNAFTNSFKGCVNLTDVYVLDAYMVGKNPSSYFESIGLTTYAQRVYMLASLGNFHEEFARDFSCWMVPEIVNLDGVEYIMYTKQAHDMKQVESAAPGCETEGYITSKCETCGYVSTEYISATGHQYDDTYVCTLCGDAPKYIPFGKLQLKDMILGKDGVYYTAEGHMVMIAVKAPLEWLGGKSLFDYVEDYGNTYFGTTYWKQLVEATNEDGYAALTKKTYTWILDVIAGNPAWGESENDLPNYLALQLDRSNIHTHQYNAVVIAPTCTDYGYTIYVCACGEKYIDNIVPSVDHKDEDDDGICDYGCGTVLKPGPDTLIITAESVKVMNGNWATITLLVEQNPGFQGMSLYPVIKDANGNTVNWVWEADVTNGQLGFDMNVGTMVVLTADANSTNTGVLLEMMFYVGEEVELGDYTISFRLYKGECFNDRGDVVYVSLPTVTVTVHDVVYGDVNGDGNIDIRDVLLLRQYLANRDPNTGESPVEVEPGADANGDGNIDIRDVLLMRQYLANRDPDTGESPIVLGP